MSRFILSPLTGFCILVLLSSLDVQCKVEYKEIEVQEVRFVTPDTYFPSEVQVKYKNVGDRPIKSVDFDVAYRSPNVDTTYWTRKITCSHTEGELQPGESYYSQCNWNGEAPPVRDSEGRKPNASLFFEKTEVNGS